MIKRIQILPCACKRYSQKVILTLCHFFFSEHWTSIIIFFFIFLRFWTNENTLTCDMLYINRIREKFTVRISQNPKM